MCPGLTVGLVRVTAQYFPDARVFYRFPLYSGMFHLQHPARRNGSPGVSTGYFQRTVVRYTGVGHMTDIGLCLVLQTRPGLSPPQICLPSTFRYGAYLYLDPRFCRRFIPIYRGFLQTDIAEPPLPLATLRLRQAEDGLCPIPVS